MPDAPDWLPFALAYIPEWLGHQMRQSEQPGCVVAIAHHGRVVLEQAFGMADAASGEGLTPRHRFRVASHSKSFTAAAVLKLREQGKLRLDDAAGQYVSGLHPDLASATIAQLLSHGAGILRNGPDCSYWSGHVPFADEARLRAELRLPPAIPANTRWKYSNHGFGLAGLVIEAVTGESYDAWIAREIVAPFGLDETTPDMPVPDGAPLAFGHSTKQPVGRRVMFPGDTPTHALAAATGFVSTATDLARFYSQLAPDTAVSALSVASRREMIRPLWQDPYAPVPRSYGLGLIVGKLDDAGEGEDWAWFGHSGGFQGFITRTCMLPAQDLTICVLTNAVDGAAHPWLDGIMHICRGFAARGAPADAVAGWTGRWWATWGAADLVPAGGRVLVAMPGLPNPLLKVPELEVTGPDQARIVQSGGGGSYGEPARIERDAAGTAVAFRLGGTRMLPEAEYIADLTARYPRQVVMAGGA